MRRRAGSEEWGKYEPIRSDGEEGAEGLSAFSFTMTGKKISAASSMTKEIIVFLRRCLRVVTLVVSILCALVGQGWGSLLVAPGAPSEDSSLGGNIVAVPLNPAAELFHSPAQLAVLPHSCAAGVGAAYSLGVDVPLPGETWELTFGTSVIFSNTRRVEPTNNPLFPGRSVMEQALFGIHLTRRLTL